MSNNTGSVLYNPNFPNYPTVAEAICHEIFELLIKANQLEEEYDPQFLYLPVLKPEVWIDCCVRLDETIDAFIIFVIESEGEVKFLWQDWREPAQVLTLGKIFSVKIERSFVIKTIDTCLQKLEADLLKN